MQCLPENWKFDSNIYEIRDFSGLTHIRHIGDTFRCSNNILVINKHLIHHGITKTYPKTTFLCIKTLYMSLNDLFFVEIWPNGQICDFGLLCPNMEIRPQTPQKMTFLDFLGLFQKVLKISLLTSPKWASMTNFLSRYGR